LGRVIFSGTTERSNFLSSALGASAAVALNANIAAKINAYFISTSKITGIFSMYEL
jgi:hypothetical protein